YRLYARNKKVHPLMFKDMRMVVAGAEKLQSEVRELFKARFNKEIYEGYGATETTPVASTNFPDILIPDDFHEQIGTKVGSVGLPLPGTSFKIVDPDSYEELAVGEDGMILIGGTQIMKGYKKAPEKTAEVIKEIDGELWYVTGDKGHIDEDGFLFIVDRYSRFAKLSGEMVSLGMVESHIAGVLEENSALSVTAIEDGKKGEALVLLLEGEMELEELKKRVKELKINPLYKPSKYHKVEQIPRLGSGKVDLKALKSFAKSLNS
ncbi:MAG TPA: acyl-[ACP]--phospholipid O-acyltransferase, partial [Nitratifractor sp.]|nr:acyl-[ACP]--phospholipid O-acyltransferase [Nitratifractor sp.]